MKLTFYDVAHGSCARLVTPNGKHIFFDCGYSDDSTPHPVEELNAESCREVEQLVISNFDQDHVRGIVDLQNAVSIRSIASNSTLPASKLRSIKEEGGGVTDAMESILGMLDKYTSAYTASDFGGVTLKFFWNKYPVFDDTNNLSLVTFVEWGAQVVLFPGDMEKAGWDKLLEGADFQEALKKVTIFVASHHGRESGFCAEVFDYCKPLIIIVSDKDYEYESQEVPYAPFAEGIDDGNGKRFVYSTRHDGSIFITQTIDGFIVTTENG
jgi:beta-lactamase superfamily II metal-dependent hydrolase